MSIPASPFVPSMKSLPAPPVMISLPFSAVILSSPARASITSSPLVPTKSSSPFVGILANTELVKKRSKKINNLKDFFMMNYPIIKGTLSNYITSKLIVSINIFGNLHHINEIFYLF